MVLLNILCSHWTAYTYTSLQVLCMDLYKRTTRWTSVWGMCYPILSLSCPLFQVSTSLFEAMKCFDTAYSLVWLYRCLSDCIMAQSCLECSTVAQSSDFNCGWCQSLNRCVSPQHHSVVLDVVCFRCSVSEIKRILKVWTSLWRAVFTLTLMCIWLSFYVTHILCIMWNT